MGLQVLSAVFSSYGAVTMVLGHCSGLFDIDLPHKLPWDELIANLIPNLTSFLLSLTVLENFLAKPLPGLAGCYLSFL